MKLRRLILIMLLTVTVVLGAVTVGWAEDAETCEHQWSDWKVKTAATVMTQGSETRSCELCDARETRKTDKLAVYSEWVKYKNKYYYFNAEGKQAIKASKYKKKWVKADGRKFYINSKHVPVAQGFHYIGGKLYYMDESRAAVTGTTFYSKDGVECKADANGCIGGRKLYQYKYKTFAYVDISEQHLWYYKSGKLMMDCNVVTGYPVGASKTPTGIYKVTRKFTNARLVGPTWDKRVKYWIGFIRNAIGFHDSPWRDASDWESQETYLTNGTAGCVTLKLEDQKKLYGYLKSGNKVIIAK